MKIINVRPGECVTIPSQLYDYMLENNVMIRVIADSFIDEDLIVINYEKEGSFETINLLYGESTIKSYVEDDIVHI